MRVLITRGSSATARRLAELLEGRSGVEAVLTVREDEPEALAQIIRGAQVDTVVEMRPRADAVAGCESAGVRKLVLKSSAHYYGFERDAPAFLTEATIRRRPPAGALERSVLAAESAAERLAVRNPGCRVAILRFADEIGTGEGSHQVLLRLPFVPCILGFDPRWQLIHAHDVAGALAHAVLRDLPGVYNVAADGVLSLSEVASLLGKPMLPVLPPLGTGLAVGQLARLGIPAPVELVGQLRFGRGLDNRRLKASGYLYRYTSRETVIKLAEEHRLRVLLEPPRQPPGS